MKNPFKQLKEQEDEIASLRRIVLMLEREVRGYSVKSDPLASKTLNERVEYLEGSLREGSAHPWIKIISAILKYLEVDVRREWVPVEWYSPPAPSLQEVVELIPRSKPSQIEPQP